MWDLGEDKPRLLHQHASEKIGVGCLTFSPDSSLLAFAGSDQAAYIWDFKDRHAKPVAFAGHADTIRSLTFSPRQDALFSCADDHIVRRWDLSSPTWKNKPRHEAILTSCILSTVAFTPDGTSLVMVRRSHNEYYQAVEQSDCTVWNLHANKLTQSVPLKGQFRGIAFLPSGALLGWGRMQYDREGRPTAKGFLASWDIATGKEQARQSFTYEIESVSIAAKSSTVAALAQLGSTIHLCDGASLQEREQIKGEFSSSRGMALTPDGTTLATIGSVNKPGVGLLKTIRLWDLRDLDQRSPRELPDNIPIAPFNHGVKHLAFSRDGKKLVAVDDRGVITLWDYPKKARLGECKERPGFSYSVAFSPDGQLLATGRGNQVTLWGTADLSERYSWSFPGPVYSIAFDRTNRWLASGNANGTAYILNLTSLPQKAKP